MGRTMKLTLSPRQQLIHSAILSGEKQKAIARRLGLNVNTVYAHSARARRKIAESAEHFDPAKCKHPNRNMNGGCDACGDPCL
jgi:DNA-directed RNA polymerase specialized sigma24 family protein